MFQNPRLTPVVLESYFNSGSFISDASSNDKALDEQLGYFNYLDWDESYRRTASHWLEVVGRYRPAPGAILEIGSATGSSLVMARAAGYAVRGLDISSAFAAMAAAHHALAIDVGWVEEFPLPERHYDVVCMFGGISCRRDLMRGLRNVYRTLKPDGVFVFNYQDCYGLLARLMGNRYSEFNHASMSILHKRAVRMCIERAGFTPVFQRTEHPIASLGRIVTYLKSRSGKRLVEGLGLQSINAPVLAIGTVLVVARKV